MSKRPRGFGFFIPTGWVVFSELPAYQAYLLSRRGSSPNE